MHWPHRLQDSEFTILGHRPFLKIQCTKSRQMHTHRHLYYHTKTTTHIPHIQNAYHASGGEVKPLHHSCGVLPSTFYIYIPSSRLLHLRVGYIKVIGNKKFSQNLSDIFLPLLPNVDNHNFGWLHSVSLKYSTINKMKITPDTHPTTQTYITHNKTNLYIVGGKNLIHFSCRRLSSLYPSNLYSCCDVVAPQDRLYIQLRDTKNIPSFHWPILILIFNKLLYSHVPWNLVCEIILIKQYWKTAFPPHAEY